MNFRRFSFGGGDGIDYCVDDLLLALYPSATDLDTKCLQSLTADRFMSLLSSPTKLITPRSGPLRTVEYEKTPEEVVEGLPPEYFIPAFDPVVAHLEEISSWDKEDIIQKFMVKIEEADTDKDVIIGHLTTMIDTNYDSLMECMSKVQEINMELCQAEMQVKHARMKIASGASVINNGCLKINTLNRQRVGLSSIASTLETLKELKDLHSGIERNLQTGAIGSAAECALLAMKHLGSGAFDQFNAFRDMGITVQNNIRTIRQKADKALQRLCCRKFNTSDYENIMVAYLKLDRIANEFSVDQFGGEEDGLYIDSMGCLDGLSHRINRFHLEDVDAVLHSAVVEFIYVGQQKRQQAASEINVPGAYNQMKLGEIYDLAEVPLHLLLRRLTQDMLPHCVVRACERLTDVVHTYFLLCQWHARPFHPNNQNWELLHGFSSNSVDLAYAVENLIDLERSSLAETHRRLMDMRASLWEEIVRALSTMLSQSLFSYDVKLEEFVLMLRALQMMISLGRQFCSLDSELLEATIQEKAIEYFRNLHFESVGAIKIMLEAESWHPVPTSISSVLELMLSTFPHESLPAASEEEGSSAAVKANGNAADGLDSPDSKNEILSQFAVAGNPFRYFLKGQGAADQPEDDSSAAPTELQCASFGSDLSRLLQSEIDAAKSQPTKRHANNGQSVVVTQVVLNGLLKSARKYLQMILLVPSSSQELLSDLFRLFDFYFCSVFVAFIPAEERARLLSVPTKTNATAPDLARDFEALQDYLERSLNSPVIVSTKSSEVNSHGPAGDSTDPSVIAFSTPSSPHKVRATIETVKLSSLIPSSTLIETGDPDTCYALIERIIAAESTAFAAQILSEIKPIFLRVLEPEISAKCEQMVEQYQLVSRQLSSLLYKSACPLLIHHSSILPSIVDCGWDSKKLREHPHDWVDKLVANCRNVWAYIMLSDQLADASAILREQIWMEVCQAAFDLLLEGFSRVKKCSSEGRAMMTMDLFAVHEGLNNVHLCRPPRGKHYIDNYLRAFYISEDELLQWVQENWQSYAYRHVLGLLTQTLSTMLANKKFKDAVALIDSLYEYEKKDSATSVTSMLSQRFKDDKFGNLISSKFRR